MRFAPDPGNACELLGAASPRRVLEGLLEGDPLRIQELARHRRSAFGALLPMRRVFLRSLARTSFEAKKFRRSMPLERWLEARIAEALVELMEEQAESERRADPLDASERAFYRELARRLSLPPKRGRAACVGLNAEPLEVRHAFFALVVEGKSVKRYADAGFGPQERVRRLLQEARRAIGRPLPGSSPRIHLP